MTMGKTRQPAAFLWILLVMLAISPTYAPAPTIEYGPEDQVDVEGLPEPIAKAVQEHEHCYGTWRSRDLTVGFRGTTKELNDFLRQVAKCTELDLTCVLHAEPGVVAPNGLSGRFGDAFKIPGPEPIDVNWALHVYHTDVRVRDLETHKTHWETERDVTVRVHLVGEIELEKLEIPVVFDVEVGGTVGDLVRFHQQRRKEWLADESTTQPAEPTTLGLMNKPSYFGSGDDEDDWMTRAELIKKIRGKTSPICNGVYR